MVRKLFICPADFGVSEQCRVLSIPNTQEWLGIFNAALLTLTNVYNYEQLNETDLTPEQCAERAMSIYVSYLNNDPCATVPSPFWDNETDNEEQELETVQEWYGYVTDWLAPVEELNFVQNAALWVLTGFVAYAAGLGSAIFFRTTAKRFIVAIEAGDVPELIRLVVDSAEFNIDTTGLEGTIINQEVIVNPDIETHDIYIIKGELP